MVLRCVKPGLLNGTKLFMDASLIDVDASNNLVADSHSVTRHLNERYQKLEKRLERARIRMTKTDNAGPVYSQTKNNKTGTKAKREGMIQQKAKDKDLAGSLCLDRPDVKK